jgi:hypothetical protein
MKSLRKTLCSLSCAVLFLITPLHAGPGSQKQFLIDPPNFPIEYRQKVGFVGLSSDGTVLFQVFAYDNGPDDVSEGLIRIVKDGRIGFADINGNIVIPPAFDHVRPFSNGLAAFCTGCFLQNSGEHTAVVNGRWGFIDKNGSIAIQPVYEKVIQDFKSSRAQVMAGRSRIFIDKNGQPVNDDTRLSGGYSPKLTPDTIIDFRPTLIDDFTELPDADENRLEHLLDLYQEYRLRAVKNPGNFVPGNMILGANKEDYQPTDDELILMELGERLWRVLGSLPENAVRQVHQAYGSRIESITYKRFSFYHVDVMGTGRFFYVDRIEKIRLLRQGGKWTRQETP